MAAPRAVRISRPASGTATEPGHRRGGPATRFQPNRGGTARAWRLFAVYAIALLAIYLLFLALALTSPVEGVRDNALPWLYLSVVTAALAAAGWLLTLGRTPSGAILRSEELVVRERTGRLRRFPAHALSERKVVHRYSPSLLGPQATEFVELRTSDRGRRTYLVGEGFFEDLAGR